MLRTLALLLLAALPAVAQQIDDPANLTGERVAAPALADTLPINHGAAALDQLLRKLRTRASMMLIVAHPDDEDGGLLTLESRGAGARVAMLTLTRGEGGQNLMSADFNDALGLIRTQELLAEDRYTGTDQFFGTEVDFGFSKTKEESLQKWGHDRVLYDAVRAVRLYRPLVLASVFVGGVTDGHGHHQVAGEICQEVFNAAADPKVFPEMGLPPWAPLRVYARVPFSPINDKGMYDYATGRYLPVRFHNYVTGSDITHEPAASVTIQEGDKPNIAAFNGMSYIQWARQGLALQKSQIGPNVRIPPAGAFDVGYTLMGSRVPAEGPGTSSQQDLFSGINTSFPAIADLAPAASASLRTPLSAIDAKLAEAQHLFDPAHLELTARPLRQAFMLLDQFIAEIETSHLSPDQKFNVLHELRIKRVQLNDALVLALGISVEAKVDAETPSQCRSFVVEGCNARVKVAVHSSGKQPVTLLASFRAYTDSSNNKQDLGAKTLAPAMTYQSFFAESGSRRTDPVAVQGDTPASREAYDPEARPYFTRPDIEQPFYDIARPSLRLAPEAPTESFFVRLSYEAVTLLAASPIAAAGPRMQPLVSVPSISVEAKPRAGVVLSGQQTFPVSVQVRKNGPSPAASREGVWLLAEGGSTPSIAYPFEKTEASVADVVFTVTADAVRSGESSISRVQTDGLMGKFTESFRPVGYPGLTYTNYYTPAIYKATAVDVTTTPGLRIAYLPGTGDDVPAFLPSLGVTPTLLKVEDLTLDKLKQFDGLVLGVRAYAAHPDLQGAASDPLKRYAEQGGVVVAQYDSGGFNPSSAPFPYSLPGDPAHNVVEESQPVTLLVPDAPLLTWPNRITSADFDHWVEERGHGFASDWSPEYTPLLETHDEGQDPQNGGLLVAKVGKGAYIYCALALYRQLPEGVPGAYRLMANLLSYTKNPSR